MDQQLHSNPPATPYHTHSLLQINAPNLGSNPKQTFQWSAQIHNDQASEFRFIFRSEEINKNNKMEYHCNPLDYGYSIVGRVLGEERSKKNVLHQTIFGPIGAQPQIFKYFSNPQKEKANILLNKIQIQAQVKIITCPFVINNNYKASIAIKTQNFNFELKIEKEVRLPPHSPFFKFYAREENAIGLSFYHQQAQFMNKLRQLNIFVHSGFYLKLFFISRQFRDAFLFQLMQYFGLIQSQTSPNQLYVPRANTRRDRSRRTSNISGYSDNRKGLDEKVVNQLDDQLFKLLYNGQDQQKRLSFSFTDAQFLLSSVRKSGIQRIQNAQTMKQLGQRDDKGTKQRYMTENKLRDEYKQLQQATRNEYKKRRSSNNLLKQHKFLNRESHFGERNHQNMSKELELRTTISKLVNQIDNLLKQNRRLSRENKKIKEQNMKLRFREIKKTFKQTFKQKKNNFNRQSGLDLNPENVTKRGTQSNGMQNLQSSGGSLMKNLQNMPRDSGNNLKISSFGPKQKTIESPGSNGTSQLSSNYNIEDRKKLQSNFASMISVSNKQFLKQKSGRSSKFIPKANSRGKSFGNKNRSINSRSQTDNSFQRPNETPSTPFFSSVTPHEAFSVKAYQSHFFQQYLSPKKER